MVSLTPEVLVIELKKRGWERFHDFFFSELEKGRNLRDILSTTKTTATRGKIAYHVLIINSH